MGAPRRASRWRRAYGGPPPRARARPLTGWARSTRVATTRRHRTVCCIVQRIVHRIVHCIVHCIVHRIVCCIVHRIVCCMAYGLTEASD